MRVRGKFFVQKVEKTAATKGHVAVTLAPVTRGHENAEWSQFTPSGQITMNITKGDAGKVFDEHVGEEFYVTFELADDQGVDG